MTVRFQALASTRARVPLCAAAAVQAAVVSIYYDAAYTEPPSYTQDFYLGYCVGSLGMTSCSST